MAKILDVKARRVWDSRGRATVEAEVSVGRGASTLAIGRGIAPAGASTGSGEAKAIDADTAVKNVNGHIRDALKAMSVSDQAALDERMIELDGTSDKSRLGANAMVAVSLACAHADAASKKIPLWRKLAGERRVALPVPQIQIYGGGAHASGRVDLQDFMVIATGAGSFSEALQWTSQVYAAAGARLAKKGALQGVADEGGYWPAFKTNEEALSELVGAIADAGFEPGVDVCIALDVAATQLYRKGLYQFSLESRALSAAELQAMLLRWIERYPIVSIEDPFAEHDAAAMKTFTQAAGEKVQIVGDDFFVTSSDRVRAADGACNTVLLKPNQIGTLTETFACWEAAREAGYRAIVSARLGRRPAQGRQLLPLRAHGEMERGPAHRGVSRRPGAALPRRQAVQAMTVVFHFDGTETLRSRLEPLGVTLCAESDIQGFERHLPDMEILWHVLKPVTAQVIERSPKLRLIQKIGSGVNTIDIEAAKKRGVAVCNLPGTNSRAVAEMTLLLILSCLRRIRSLDDAVRRSDWKSAWKLQDHLGEIGGRTVGLVGYGEVPKILAPMLTALQARVLYWSRTQSNADFDTVVGTSDVVSLHVPLTPQTDRFIDPRRMKRGAILVNTARGALVDEDLLVEALKNGHLAAAGLDVFAEEPPLPGNPLLALPNVVCAPHLAWLTQETLERSIVSAFENVQRLRRGEPLRHRVA
jgi:enolase